MHTSGDLKIRVHTVVDGKPGRIIMVCLFVCLLYSVFDDTLISNTEYISWNDKEKCLTKWEGCGCKMSHTNCRHCPRISRQRTRTTTENLSQHSRRHG